VRQVLSFAKEAPLKTIRINVNQPVTEIMDALIARRRFKDIELTLDLQIIYLIYILILFRSDRCF